MNFFLSEYCCIYKFAGEKLGFLIWYALIFQKVVVIFVEGWGIVYIISDSANKLVRHGVLAFT